MEKLIFEGPGLQRMYAWMKKQDLFEAGYGRPDTDFPSFLLVKDEGIYLMSASKTPDLLHEGGCQRHVVYATGFDPNNDEDYYQLSRESVGGDDFSQPLPLSPEMMETLSKDGCKVEIEVDSKTIGMTIREG